MGCAQSTAVSQDEAAPLTAVAPAAAPPVAAPAKPDAEEEVVAEAQAGAAVSDPPRARWR